MSEIVEFRVKLNGIKDGKDTNDNLLFKDIYDKGKNILEDIIKNQDKNKNNLQNTNSVSNIIAFCGDRGTGKTSAMNEFSEKYMVESLKCVEVLPTIDPTLLSSNDSVLEIVIAKLFKGLDIEKISDPERQRKILSEFEKVYNQLSTLYQKKKERFVKDFNGGNLELISRLQSSLDITNTLENIINLYLEDKNEKTRILIKIDDVDMNLKNAYAMIEEIRKYLNVNNLIILVAFNDVQMNALLSKKFNNELGENNSNILASNYLTKLFPPQNRLYMPKLDKFILSNEATFVGYDKDGKEVKNNSPEKSIVETILGEIFNKTRLIFLKNKYGFNTLIPTNLRELSQLRLFLENLETVKDGNNVFDDIYENETNIKIRKNLILFRDYFLYERINSDLSYDELEFLRMLPNLQAGKVNKEIHLYFTNKAKELEISLDVLKNEDEDVNVLNMARIITEINIVRENDKGANDQFVYYVKCLYSMIILENTLIAISDNKPNNLLGNIGKYIIGSYKGKPEKFEYEFYPSKDANSEETFIKSNRVSRIDKLRLLGIEAFDDAENNDAENSDAENNIANKDINFGKLLDKSNKIKNDFNENLEKILNSPDDLILANYLFLFYISYGKFEGEEFITIAKTYVGDAGISNAYFRINNLIYHLLDFNTSISRNFNDIVDYTKNDIQEILEKSLVPLKDNENYGDLFNIKNEILYFINKFDLNNSCCFDKKDELINKFNNFSTINEKLLKSTKTLEYLYDINDKINKLLKNLFKNYDNNTYLLLPIYSVDYVEKINSFEFSYKNEVNKKNFYSLMFDNFFSKISKCNREIIGNNEFLIDVNINELVNSFTSGLNEPIRNSLDELIKIFLITENLTKESKKTINKLLKDIKISNKTGVMKKSVEDIKKLYEALEKMKNSLNTLKEDSDYDKEKIDNSIKRLTDDIEIYKNSVDSGAINETEMENRNFKLTDSLKKEIEAIVNGTN